MEDEGGFLAHQSEASPYRLLLLGPAAVALYRQLHSLAATLLLEMGLGGHLIAKPFPWRA